MINNKKQNYQNTSRFFISIIFIIISVLASTPCLAKNVIWLEAEQFDNTGGWSNDSQFVDLMGSPYLLAAGLGKPVDDAATQAYIPETGKYTLWGIPSTQYHLGPGQAQFGSSPKELI